MEVIPATIEFAWPRQQTSLDLCITQTLMGRTYQRVNADDEISHDYGPGQIKVGGVEHFCEPAFVSSARGKGILVVTIAQLGAQSPDLNTGGKLILGVTCIVHDVAANQWRLLQSILTDPENEFRQYIGWDERSPLPVHVAILSQMQIAGMFDAA